MNGGAMNLLQYSILRSRNDALGLRIVFDPI